MNLWSAFEEKFKKNANYPAMTMLGGKNLSYGELYNLVDSISDEILKYVSEYDKVSILNSHTCYDALGVLGTIASGCTAVPMSLNYGEENCYHIMNIAEPKLLITDINPLPQRIQELIEQKKIRIVNVKDISVLDKEIVIKRKANRDIKLAMIMFTSGTTGIPKGVMLGHRNILSNLYDIADYFDLTPNDHILIPRPLYHAAVMTGEFFHALMCGCRISFYSEPFLPRRLFNVLECTKCTVICGTPTLMYYLSQQKYTNLLSLRKIVVSGECLHYKVAEKLIEAFPNASIFNVYGLTEASPRVSFLDPLFFGSKIGSVGKPLKSVKIRIVDDNGNQTPLGEPGELIVSGPNVMLGYFNDEEQTKKRIINDWLYTGDIAYMDSEGFLYIVGRIDHMIIRAGVNIYPQVIEKAILEKEVVKEVIAWGENDPKYGQRICIACVPNENCNLVVADIMSICRKELEPYLWPDEVNIVECLPKNASGKLLRRRPSNL